MKQFLVLMLTLLSLPLLAASDAGVGEQVRYAVVRCEGTVSGDALFHASKKLKSIEVTDMSGNVLRVNVIQTDRTRGRDTKWRNSFQNCGKTEVVLGSLPTKNDGRPDLKNISFNRFILQMQSRRKKMSDGSEVAFQCGEDSLNDGVATGEPEAEAVKEPTDTALSEGDFDEEPDELTFDISCIRWMTAEEITSLITGEAAKSPGEPLQLYLIEGTPGSPIDYGVTSF